VGGPVITSRHKSPMFAHWPGDSPISVPSMHAPEQQNIDIPRPCDDEQSVVCEVYVAWAVIAGEGGGPAGGKQTSHSESRANPNPSSHISTPYLAPRYRPRRVVSGPNSSNRKPIPPPIVLPTETPIAAHNSLIVSGPASSVHPGFSQYHSDAAHTAEVWRLSSPSLFRFFEVDVDPDDPTISSSQESRKYSKVPSS
jgi:hypothetical protein